MFDKTRRALECFLEVELHKGCGCFVLAAPCMKTEECIVEPFLNSGACPPHQSACQEHLQQQRPHGTRDTELIFTLESTPNSGTKSIAKAPP